jgi:hypothetical protein
MHAFSFGGYTSGPLQSKPLNVDEGGEQRSFLLVGFVGLDIKMVARRGPDYSIFWAGKLFRKTTKTNRNFVFIT